MINLLADLVETMDLVENVQGDQEPARFVVQGERRAVDLVQSRLLNSNIMV